MIIKKGSEYLDFSGDIEIDQQVASIETLDSVGTFSYSFTIPPTQKNKRILGLESIDKLNKGIFTTINDIELQTESGVPLLIGSLLVTNSIGIDCSFVSGNTTFFNSIQGNIGDVDLSDFDTLLTEASIVNSWTKTDGIVFPLSDRGQLSLRKDAFMKMRKFNGLVYQNDWQPFVYIKSVIQRCLQKSGLKISGDLVNDPIYSSLITTNNSSRYKQQRFKETNVFIGKTTSQTITDAGFSHITFNDALSGQFYNSIKGNYNTSTNKWTVPFDCVIRLTYVLNTSDATKLIQFQYRRSGIDIGEEFVKGLKLSFDTSDQTVGNEIHCNANDYFELYAKVDSSTPGSVQILSGTFLGEVKDTSFIFAQGLLPDQDSKTFIKDIFRMFNVVCSFDSFTKTINTTFFKNIAINKEQDFSGYIDSYNAENGFELVSGYTQSNNVKYKDDSTQEILNYNNANTIPYGAGQIKINNQFIDKTSDLFQIGFTAPFSDNYPYFGVQMIKMNFVEYEVNDNTTIDDPITSVSNSGGLAQFNGASAFPVTSTYYNNLFKGNAQGRLQDATIKENDSDTQIIAINVPNVLIPNSFRFSEGFNADNWYIVRATNFTITSYNGDWEWTAFSSTTRTHAAVALFANFIDGTQLDAVRQGLSFGAIVNKQSETLLDTYYSKTISTLNDPVKLLANMYIPEKDFINFDFLKPVRIKTKDFNSLFFCQKIRGYKNSKTPCIMELVKIN